MKRRCSLWVMWLLLLALLLPGGAALADEGLSDFKDTENHWASEAIVQSRALDLLNGYDGNVFKPKNPVSKAEAVVIIIRAMGLDAQAANTGTAGVSFPAGVGKWCQGHIVLAADKGMISKTNIPSIAWNAPASRLEVALWLAAGLKLGSDNATLPFSDIGSVPSGYRGMLGAVVQKGIMTGTSATTFAPNKTLTRAEMASLLSKMLGSGYVATAQGRFVVGKLAILDWTGKKVTMETAGGTKTYTLASSYLAFKGGKKVAIGVLPLGENVKLVLDGNGRCLFIGYYGGSSVPSFSGNSYHGKITMIAAGSYPFMSFQAENGTLLSLPVDLSAKVTVRGAASSLAAVTVGASGTITVSNSKITAIDLDSGSTSSSGGLDGYVVNKYWDCFSIRYDDGTSEEIDIDGLTFTKNGVASSYAAVTRGTPVQLVKIGSRVTGVIILSDARKVFGEVTRISSRSITIEDSDDYDQSYDLASRVDIEDRDGDDLDWDEIEKGDEVALTLNRDDEAAKIEVGVSSSELEGVVDYIRTSGSEKIRIVNDDDDEYTYYIDDDVTVKEGSRTRDLDDIDEGDEVRLTLNNDDNVIKIEILDKDKDKDEVEGTVIDLDIDDDNGEIEIKDDDGDKDTYDLDDDVTVKEGSRTRDLDDIDEGDEVRLTLNNDDDVIKIEILDKDKDKDEIEGSVTGLDLRRERITIKDDDGDKKTYTFDADDVDMDNVLIGAEVIVTINDDDEVVDIDITNDEDLKRLTGELTDVNTSREYVKIEQDSGNVFKFSFVSRPYLYDDDGDRIDIDDLDDYEDEDVEFDLDDKKIKKLWVQ